MLAEARNEGRRKIDVYFPPLKRGILEFRGGLIAKTDFQTGHLLRRGVNRGGWTLKM